MKAGDAISTLRQTLDSIAVAKTKEWWEKYGSDADRPHRYVHRKLTR
jgi:hypothetical protein